MTFVRITGFRTALANMQGRRGLRAGLAVGLSMLTCLLLHHPMGWVALGALQVVMVDNGGPYRSRLFNSLTVLFGGSIAVGLGVIAGINLPTAIALTLVFAFAITLARVLSQPLASCSVVVLVTYIVAFGTPFPTHSSGIHAVADFIYGAIWAATLVLLFWPADPFRPARNAVANAYAALANMAALLPIANTAEGSTQFNDALANFRTQIEAAQQTLALTPARMTARTIRARNLSVLNESADLLLARVIRIAELTATTDISPYELAHVTHWLTASLAPIEPALRQKPAQGVSAFAPFGSFSVELHRSLNYVESSLAKDPTADPNHHIAATLRDALLNFEVSYEAILAIWSGSEPRRLETAAFRTPTAPATIPISGPRVWLDTLRANLSSNSVMFRHALRLAAVVTIDVLILHFIHISHGYWLPMTSVIVLQPYTGETVRRSTERVAGTIAGGLLAAVLAASIHTELGILIVITLGSAITIALYAVDYVWYSFFLTPTIVLMTLPQLRDWHFAAVRMGMTGLGALVAVLAMVFLWPEHASLQLPALLARGASADAAYLRALLAYWKATANTAAPNQRLAAERSILAPARRRCGLAVNDAEETLDHALLEHHILSSRAHPHTDRLNRAALTFTTYLRRLTQTLTTLAAIGDSTNTLTPLIPTYADRIEAVAFCVQHNQPVPPQPSALASLPDATEPLARLDRQISVLEHTANDLAKLSHA